MEFTAKNITNYVPSEYTLNTIQNFGRSPSANIYKRKSRNTVNSICRKTKTKTQNKHLAVYISQPKHALEKQNILNQIKIEKLKVLNQEHLNQKLISKLEKKQSQKILAFSLTKGNFFKTSQQEKSNSRLAYNFKANETHQKNLQKSINEQLKYLQEQLNKNNMQIQKIKKSKKYTKFMEVAQQKKICLVELKQLKSKLRMMKSQIINKKRLNRQVRKRKIDTLVMEGQVQDNLEKQNIEIYRRIQQVNIQNRQMEMKKISLKDKKKKLFKQIQFMRKNYYQSKNSSHSKKSTAITNIDYWNSSGRGLSELKEQQQQDQSFVSKGMQQNKRKNIYDKKSEFGPMQPHIERKFQTQDFQEVSNSQIKNIERKYFQNLQDQQPEDQQISSQDQDQGQDKQQQEYDQQDFQQSQIQYKPSLKKLQKEQNYLKGDKRGRQRVSSI